MSATPAVSVVLPTYNRLERLRRALAALEEQDISKDLFEVIVISDGSTDGTNEFLQRVETNFRLVPVFQNNQGPAAARNAGMEKANGKLIVFLDDDVYPVPQLLSEHIRSHQNETCQVAAIGPMLSPPGHCLSYWVRWGHEKLAEQYNSMMKNEWKPAARQFYTGNASFPRRLYQCYGGFDEAFHRAEDVELAYRYDRNGVQFRFNPSAIGYHFEERSFQAWTQIAYEYGKSDVIFTSVNNYAWLLPTIFQEFRKRPRLIQWITFLCLDRHKLSHVITRCCDILARGGDRFKIDLPWRTACSAIFNLNYYQGVADELGGRNVFFAAAQNHYPIHSDERV